MQLTAKLSALDRFLWFLIADYSGIFALLTISMIQFSVPFTFHTDYLWKVNQVWIFKIIIPYSLILEIVKVNVSFQTHLSEDIDLIRVEFISDFLLDFANKNEIKHISFSLPDLVRINHMKFNKSFEFVKIIHGWSLLFIIILMHLIFLCPVFVAYFSL